MNARVNKALQKAAMISNVQVLIKFDTGGATVQNCKYLFDIYNMFSDLNIDRS